MIPIAVDLEWAHRLGILNGGDGLFVLSFCFVRNIAFWLGDFGTRLSGICNDAGEHKDL